MPLRQDTPSPGSVSSSTYRERMAAMTPAAVDAYLIAEKAKKERRDARRRVAKLPLTKSERDILLAVVNLWFARRYRDGFIRPGRKLVAKKVRVSVVTVARAFSLFRSLGFMEAVAYEKGGTGKATHYVVNLTAIQEAAEPCTVTTTPGVLVPFRPRQTVSRATENDTVSAYQNDTLSIGNHSDADPGAGQSDDMSEVPF